MALAKISVAVRRLLWHKLCEAVHRTMLGRRGCLPEPVAADPPGMPSESPATIRPAIATPPSANCSTAACGAGPSRRFHGDGERPSPVTPTPPSSGNCWDANAAPAPSTVQGLPRRRWNTDCTDATGSGRCRTPLSRTAARHPNWAEEAGQLPIPVLAAPSEGQLERF